MNKEQLLELGFVEQGDNLYREGYVNLTAIQEGGSYKVHVELYEEDTLTLEEVEFVVMAMDNVAKRFSHKTEEE